MCRVACGVWSAVLCGGWRVVFRVTVYVVDVVYGVACGLWGGCGVWSDVWCIE